MSYECHDVCNTVSGMLRTAGIDVDANLTGDVDQECPEGEIIEALDLCSLERDEFLKELAGCLSELTREYEGVMDGEWWRKRNHELLARVRAVTAKTEGKPWLGS